MKKKIPYLAIYFGILGVIGAAMLAVYAWNLVGYVKGTKVLATITEVHHQRVKTGSRKQTSSQQTKLSIQYQVGDTKVQSVIELSGNQKYSEGDEILISYRPEKPEKQVSQKGLIHDTVWLIIYLIFVGAQVVLFLKYRRNAKRSDVPQ